MSSSQQSNLRCLKDISFFIRNTYSHTISLQKSLLGEVTVGTLKVGKNVNGFEPRDNTKPSSKKASQAKKGINIERDQSNGVSNDVDELLLPSNSSINQNTHAAVVIPHEKHVIKIWDKMMLHQLKDRVCENPLIEIEIMQRFCSGNNCHPYFVKFINAFEDCLSYCTLLEYVPAGDLCNYVQQHGAFEFERARRYAKQTTLAVAHLHKHGYCHLDLSLENILLDQATDTIKLCDFGLCRKILPNNKPFGAAFMPPGKKSYMAPEVYNNSPFFGDKADVFSLGVIFFILFCGFPPFEKPCLADPCFRHIYEKDISVLLEKWQLTHAISPQCADMLNKIFVPDIKRVNTQELLAHPFWAGVQLKDINVRVTPETKMKEELERSRHASMQSQNTVDTDDGSNVGNVTSDESELKPIENCRTICQDQSESKFENENRNEVDIDYSLDVQTVNLDFQSLNLDFQYSKRSDTALQPDESCEIRKRNFACDNDDGDVTEENVMDGIWNLEGQSDNE